MATTQAILAQYGGVMTAAAEPATVGAVRGVRYSLCLPLAADVHEVLAAVEAAEKPGSGPVAETILLVEEEPLIRELSRDILERQGFRVLTAGNAGEGERIARGREAFDVLIADRAANGSALIPLLRELRPGLRILFVSGYSDASPESMPLPDGCAILRKPFSGDSLGRKIRQLLDREG